ncbi:MAG: polyphosphate polymerase domain-containing protein [Bacillota bacterium]|nr:polyphosphate polymerase domain-containing protein [Bacillota bacterium]
MTKAEKAVKLRHEFKHQISLLEDLVLTQRLEKLFAHDKNAGPDGSYRVCSLYYDGPGDNALREKLDGADRREKFRLRYYGEDFSFFRLEKKFKIKGLCGKRSARLCREEVEQLLSGNEAFLMQREEPLLQEFYSKIRGQLLRPKTIVCYNREAFLYKPGNVRVTLDRRIRSGLYSLDFLNPRLPLLKVAEEISILEVKYDSFLPELVRMAVQIPGRQSMACSKYALCRRFD